MSARSSVGEPVLAPDRRQDRRRAYAAAAAAWLFVVIVVMVCFEPSWLVGLDGAVGRPAFALTRSHEAVRAWWTFDASAQRPDTSRLVLLLVVAVLWWRGRGWSATWVLASAVLSVVAAPFVKGVVDRPRPVWNDPIMVLTDPSFPSGHATAAWVLAATVVLLCLDHEIPGRRHRLLVVAVIGAAVVVSADRVFLGVHYLSDTVGGAVLGVLVVLTCHVAVSAVQRVWDRRRGAGIDGERR